MLTLKLAAAKAGVSDKTLRRAIDGGKLTAHQRDTGKKQNNQPIYIDEQELEVYIASRQVQATHAQPTSDNLATRLAELEQTVQRMQEAQLLGAGRDPLALGPADDAYTQNRIDALEKNLKFRIQMQETLLNAQYQTIVSLQTAQTGVQRERKILKDRIAALETALQETQGMVIKLSNPHGNAVPAQPAQKETSTPDPEDAATFELADFTQLLQHEYRSSATRGDVKAWLTLRPEPLGIEGDYHVDYFACGRADGKKSMGKEQQARGEQLKSDLRARVRTAAFQAGWQDGPHDIFVCPGGKG
jgi:hypothetical protein